MDRKKILFLTRSFPDTRRSATTLCTHRVIECVSASQCYDIHVLCLQYKGEEKVEIYNNITVHRINGSLWSRIINWINDNRKESWFVQLLDNVQKAITVPIYPRKEPITTFYYYKKASNLHKQLKFDLIFSEHHYLSTLLAGCRLKQRFVELKHVAAFWDPLKGERQPRHLPQKFMNHRIDAMELYVAKNTTVEISMAIMKDYFKKEYDVAYGHRVFLDIPTLLKPEPVVPTAYLKLLRKDAINIVYSGVLAPKQRNPLPIIHLLNKCSVAERVNLVFFCMGAGDILQNAKLNFKGTIIQHDYIPLNELHSIYKHADYLLNISHINPNMVPSKLFEYMSYGKPIISVFVTEGDAAQKCILRYPNGICVDLKNDDKDNIILLNQFFSKKYEEVSYTSVRDSFKENTPEAYLDLINELLYI